jgi:hypothetical protein
MGAGAQDVPPVEAGSSPDMGAGQLDMGAEPGRDSGMTPDQYGLAFICGGYLPQNPGTGFIADKVVGCVATKSGSPGQWDLTNIGGPGVSSLALGTYIFLGNALSGISPPVVLEFNAGATIRCLDGAGTGQNVDAGFAIFRLPVNR